MRASWRGSVPWLVGWAALSAAGALALVRLDIAQRRDAFQSEARAAHRLLGQSAAQHDAILATLGLLALPGAQADRPEQRLPALYPQVLAVRRQPDTGGWPEPALEGAQQRSRATRHAALGRIDPDTGQFDLGLAGEPASFALRIDAHRMVPWDGWPLAREGPVSVSLAHAGSVVVLQPGAPGTDEPSGLTRGFTFAQPLDSASQPFELRLRRAAGPAQWPWPALVAWAAACAAGLAAAASWRRVRRERRRAEALLRVGQAARLNAMGELAAGIAHELNQPLAAVLANAQAAGRLLDDDPPQLEVARDAMSRAAAQARRAADVVARLRRLVETPEAGAARRAVELEPLLREALDLLEPQLRRHGVRVELAGASRPVSADPVALEQVVHNLLGNALQALQDVPAAGRTLRLECGEADGRGTIVVTDSGPGIAVDPPERVFEPFYTTRPGGLGLGLGLCETLVQSMGGTLTVSRAEPRGTAFRVALPLADADTP